MGTNDGMCMLCEQGDMGLFQNPVSEQDQQKLQEQSTTEETKADK